MEHWRRLHPARRWLAALITAHLALGLLYDWATPIFEAPDEGYHMAFIRWVGQGRGLPLQTPDAPGEWEQEGSQPPLYYWMTAYLITGLHLNDWPEAFVHNPYLRHEPGIAHNANAYRHRSEERARPVTGTAAAVHVARGFSLALSAVTLGLVYGLALAVFPRREWLALLAAALAGLNPQALFINAAVNNDNLLMVLSTAALWIMADLLRPEARGAGCKLAVLGALLGLAALTKISGLVLWPVAAVVVGWRLLGEAWWRQTTDDGRPTMDDRRAPASRVRFALRRSSFVWGGALMFGIALLICGWWYWRNFQLYGEWLGLETMVRIAGPREPAIGLLTLIREEWYGFFASFWAVFGAFTILAAPWVYVFFGWLTLAALAGGARAAWRRRGRLQPAVWLLVGFAALTLVGVVRWTLQTPATQGRLMFGAIGAAAVLMARGFVEWSGARGLGRRREAWEALVVAGAMGVVAAIVPVAYIAPRYAPPVALRAEDLPAALRPVNVLVGDGITILGYVPDEGPVAPGERQVVTLYWQARQTMARDYTLALHLLGREVEEVGKLDTWPGGGLLPTSQWEAGVIYADRYELPVAAGARTPTLLWLALNFWEDDPARNLPMRSEGGGEVASVVMEVGRAVADAPPEVRPTIAVGAEFEGGIMLEGYDAAANGALAVTLYWRLAEGAEPLPQLHVFRHLMSEAGVLVMEPADSRPLNGDWPTTAWLPGETVLDEAWLALPPNLGPGRYDLRVGLYDPESGERTPAYRPDGSRWPDDAVVLEGVVRR